MTANDSTSAAVADDQVMLVVHLKIKAGAQEEMRAALERLADGTRTRDRGVVRFEVGLDPADATRVVGYEVWESPAALEEHAAKEHTQAFLASARGLVVDPAEPLQVERWRPLVHDPPAGYAATDDLLREAAPPPAGFRSERRRVGDAELHYVIGGSGSLVVLLHGFPDTWYAWRDVMPVLAETMTVVAPDLPGLGDSDDGGRPFDVPADVEALSGLLAGLGAGPALLAGQDWGGSIAFALAAAHPEAVRALAVIEAMPAGPWTDPDAASPWFVGFSQIPDLPEHLVEGRERVYLDWLYQAFTATPGVPDERAVDEYLRTYSRPGSMAAALELYRTVDRQIEHNTRHASEPIAVPTLAVGGEHVFGAAVGDNLRDAAADLRTEVLDGCGHYVGEERPRELAELLLQFSGTVD
jgi:pimeloyl-ACP methyl ester carboxylesterase/quinol monooxygenase YgiN